jgi:hypothetical protein
MSTTVSRRRFAKHLFNTAPIWLSIPASGSMDKDAFSAEQCRQKELVHDVYLFCRSGGSALSPFNAWV